MATKSLTIPRKPVYPPSMDYGLLRREGLRHLERLGSAIWTDYNSHDPGVTMLEVLCYALTDLGYRAQLPAEDLFLPSGKRRRPFFTASEILPNAPVTALDFRKLLIDIDGVKNAWLEAFKSRSPVFQYDFSDASTIDLVTVPGFAECLSAFTDAAPATIEMGFASNAKALWTDIELAVKAKSDQKTIHKLVEKFYADCCVDTATGNKPDSTSIYAKSLVLFLIENRFAEVKSHLLADLNSEDPDDQQKAFALLDLVGRLRKALSVYKQTADPTEVDKGYTAIVSDAEFIDAMITRFCSSLLLREKLTIQPVSENDPKYPVFKTKGIYKVYLQLEEGREADRAKITREALRRLHANRALCEDFGGIKVIEEVSVGVQTIIDIATDADVVQVFAEVLFAIESFLSPPVRMYSLEEMMDRYARFSFSIQNLADLSEAGMPDDLVVALEPLIGKKYEGKAKWENAVRAAIGELAAADYESLLFEYAEKRYESHAVFQGPLLVHGWIDDGELEAAQWRRTVYRSDLFQVLSKVQDVLRVEELKVKKCPNDDENPATVEGEWCLSFDCECQPTLELDFLTGSRDSCSSFRFTKNGNPIPLTDSMQYEVFDRIIRLRAMYAKVDRTGRNDLAVPTGNRRDDLAEYTSIQEEFPRTYHVGREGIARSETPLRKAQAKQMKGYLMFFDQILANYLQQLDQVRELLALDGDLGQAALYQPLYDVTNVKPLLNAIGITDDWDTFIDDPGNTYIQALKNLTEGSDVTQKLRKNQILDHLLARFGEQFNDYVLELFRIERPVDEVTDDTGEISDWAEDKQRFLKNLPLLGSQRGRGFNYRADPEDDNRHFWDSDNVEGFKRRVMAQLGVEDWSRRTISSAPQFNIEVRTEMFEKTKRYRFGVRPEEGEVLLFSKATYNQASAAQKAGNAFSNKSAYDELYGIFDNDKGLWFVGFWPENAGAVRNMENAILISEPFRSHEEAKKRLAYILQFVNRERQNDSFHVVEHVLLRPADEFYHVLKPAPDATLPDAADSYSFRLTILVPAWGDRFSDAARYRQFEQLVRTELPVHTSPRFAMLDRNAMLDFEGKYYLWLSELTKAEPDAFELRKAANDLIDFLNQH